MIISQIADHVLTYVFLKVNRLFGYDTSLLDIVLS